MTRVAWGVSLAAVAGLAGCGGGEEAGGGGRCTPGPSAAFTLMSSGVSPAAVCVLPNGSVTFTNGDSVAHDIQSSGVCSELDLGAIAPGASKSATFAAVGVCTFRDAGAPSDTRFQGTVAVTTVQAEGPGY
jgi:hypothetical protein